ncbi:hypothetical protein GCM10017687_26970 [Streptomyces echinatus]
MTREEGAVTAADLLARAGACSQVSRGRYRTDADSRATVRVCGTRDAVFWKADLDIDCDGRPSARCNRRTDPVFADTTAFQQSDGRHLSAERLPYVRGAGPQPPLELPVVRRTRGLGGGRRLPRQGAVRGRRRHRPPRHHRRGLVRHRPAASASGPTRSTAGCPPA